MQICIIETHFQRIPAWADVGYSSLMSATHRERGARVRFPPPLVFLAAVLAGIAVQKLVRPLHIPGDGALRVVAGIAVAIAGLSFVVSARALFFKTHQNPVPWTPSPALIASGPYRFTRNPMYVGITLLLIGVGTAVNVPWIPMFAPLALACVHVIAVRPEERYLADKFGVDYEAYRARVRRYL